MTAHALAGIKFGVTSGGRDGVPEQAEDLGFDSVWVGGHFYFRSPMPDPLSSLPYVAARTQRVQIGTNVLVLPLLHPVVVGKWAADVDILSGGRMVLGVGVGGEFPPEFDACGVPYAHRGPRAEEGIEILHKVFTGEKVAHEGRFYQFGEFQLQPPPVQPNGPPIWTGGRSEAAARRAGRLCDGYIPYMVSTESVAARYRQLQKAAQAAGRDGAAIERALFVFLAVSEDGQGTTEALMRQLSGMYQLDFGKVVDRYCIAGTPDQCQARVAAFVEAGVQHFIFGLALVSGQSHAAALQLLANGVLGR